MPDNATILLQEELARRGRNVNLDELDAWLSKSIPPAPAVAPQTAVVPSQTRAQEFFRGGELPDWYEPSVEEDSDVSLLNAIGVGLWSFADTAAFGIPGLAVDEEEFLDFEDPLGKWTGAIGGFGGFVAGAPMKIGGRAVKWAAGKAIPRFSEKASVNTVVKAMTETGVAGGLSRKSIRHGTKGYQSLVKRAQINPALQGAKFEEAVLKYSDDLAAKSELNGILNADEAVAFRNMFKEARNRPLSDFKGLAVDRYGNTRKARWLGHAIDDVLMFSFIDTVFEGVSTVEDHEFDFTAPMWGAINGLAFSGLGFLKPKGKASSWWRDFKVGAKASFGGKSAYKKMDKAGLAGVSRFMAEARVRNGESEYIKHTYKGIRGELNLTALGKYHPGEKATQATVKEFERVFGAGNAEKAMKSFLEAERKKWGNEIMRWSTKEEASNMFQVMPRMILGGLLFNAHSFYEIYAHDMEASVHDILPHFLIGAYLQRHNNPSKFDLDSNKMNRIRENLYVLGFEPRQLTEFPSFAAEENQFRNLLHQKKFQDDFVPFVESLEVISDSNEVVSRKLSPREISIATETTQDPYFDQIYDLLRGQREKIKPKDAISVKVKDQIVKAFKKIQPDIKTPGDFEMAKDKASLAMTESFENNFPSMVRKFAENAELKITTKTGREDDIIRAPELIGIDAELNRKARDGELSWLVEADGVTPRTGADAESHLKNKIDGANAIIHMSNFINKLKFNSKDQGNTVTVKEESTLRNLYETVNNSERNVNDLFENKAYHVKDFSYSDNFRDYARVMGQNYALRVSRGVIDIFKPEFKGRDNVAAYLRKGGVLDQPAGVGEHFIIKSVDKIRIENAKNEEEAAELKRFLGRVLSLQSVVGNYRVTEATTSVDASEVTALRNRLKTYGYDESRLPSWLHSHIMDVSFREKIKGTNLVLSEVDSIMKLSALGFADVGVEVGKKASGFSVRFIDEGMVPRGLGDVDGGIKEYNRTVRDIIDKSNGLITEHRDKVILTDADTVQLMRDALPRYAEDSAVAPATQKLAEFLDLVGQKPGTEKFRNTLGKFIEDGGVIGQTRALLWLQQAGLLKKDKTESKWNVELKNFNREIQDRIIQKVAAHGVSPLYAERSFETRERNASDRRIREFGGDYISSMTLPEFFNRYRLHSNDNDYSNRTKEEQVLLFNNLAQLDPTNRVLARGSMQRILNAIHFRHNDEWHSYLDMSRSADRRERSIARGEAREILWHLTGLISTRKGQREKDLISWRNGKFVRDHQYVQHSRFEAFFDLLDIPYKILNPFAPVYLFSEDGNSVRRTVVNIFGKTSNLSKENQERIQTVRDQFERLADVTIELPTKDGLVNENIQGENSERGFMAIRLAPNVDPVIVNIKDVQRVKERFDEFANEYLADGSGLDNASRRVIEDIQRSLQRAEDTGVPAVNIDYEQAIRRLMMRDMLTGSDGNSTFVEFLNADGEIDKLFGRARLYNTKNFIKVDRNFIEDIADGYAVAADWDRDTRSVLRRRAQRNGWGVAIWNDEAGANLRQEVERLVRDTGVNWSMQNSIGNAHEEVSSFDSIAFVSKETLRFGHIVMGHDPSSMNPYKPVISAGGEGSQLLLGKTLFVYSSNLDPFFSNNRGVDILLTRTGAKAVNGDTGTMIDSSWDNLNTHRIADSANQIRNISLDSVGFKPTRDAPFTSAKESTADDNYRDNKESAEKYDKEIKPFVEKHLTSAKKVTSDPVSLRQFILDTFGDDALTISMDGSESIGHLNGLFYFASLSRDANVMSYSPNIVKNKIFDRYIDTIINRRRSMTEPFRYDENESSSERYGGQSVLIQAPFAVKYRQTRLRPTLADEGGVKMRGEVLLGDHERASSLASLLSGGREMRITSDKWGRTVMTPEEFLTDYYEANTGIRMTDKQARDNWKALLDADFGLGHFFDFIEGVNSDFPHKNYQVGIIVNRKPRTRPNDLALMSLAGFLPDTYGNSMMINSWDVVNVFEGDYDADKADYFWSSNKHNYDHISRTEQHFVQGIDPTKLMARSKFNWKQNAAAEHDMVEEMAADLETYKSGIGNVQKVARKLQFMGSLGNPEGKGIKGDEYTEKTKTIYNGPKGSYKIVVDFDETDFYQRSALETQYIIDGKGRLNGQIADDIMTWGDRFLFPTREESFTAANLNASFSNQISRSGRNANDQRVRIFRRLDKNDAGEYKERQDLSHLDKTILRQILSEYGKLLNVAGDKMFENTGEKSKVNYEDVIDGTERFVLFNRDIRNSLYYRLRNQRQSYRQDRADLATIYKKRWRDDPEFKALFGVKEKQAFKGKGKKKQRFTYSTATNKDMFDATVDGNAKSFGEGTRGSPIERILYRVYDSNLFDETRHANITGEPKRLMDAWYSELIGDINMTPEQRSANADRFTAGVQRATWDFNRKVDLITSLKKKIGQIMRNKNQSWKVKNLSIEKLNDVIRGIESELGNQLKIVAPEYAKTKKSADLKKLTYVNVDTEKMRNGTIYYSTMEQLKRSLPFNPGRTWGLSAAGQRDLNFIKKIRKIFYGNQERLGDVMKWGGKSLLTNAEQEYLKDIPDVSTFYEIEGQLLQQGAQRHGRRFIYAFMQPVENKAQVGIFEGRPINVPYEASDMYDPSSRYRRGINFLTRMAQGNLEYMETGDQRGAQETLSVLQFTEAHYNRFFNKSFDFKDLVAENLGDDVSIAGVAGKQVLYNDMRLPNFNKDFESSFVDFRSIKWTKTTDRIRNGFSNINDHLLRFYNDLMQAAGKEGDFQDYIVKMNELEQLQMENNIIDPIKYLDLRMNMSEQVRQIAEITLQKALGGQLGDTELAGKILGNPVFALMGGQGYFKGITLEKDTKFSLKRLEQMKDLSDVVQKAKTDMPIKEAAEKTLSKFEEDYERLVRERECAL